MHSKVRVQAGPGRVQPWVQLGFQKRKFSWRKLVSMGVDHMLGQGIPCVDHRGCFTSIKTPLRGLPNRVTVEGNFLYISKHV